MGGEHKVTSVGISVVIPAYNEEDNIAATITQVSQVLESLGGDWEILVVNDGSTDRTLEIVKQVAAEDSRIGPISYVPNVGRGRALRTGFAHARGDIVISTDADLSYEPKYIVDLVNELKNDASVDLVLASPYIKGGRTEGVPLFRLLISKMGNRILSLAMGRNIRTITGIFRAYRRPVLESLELESDGKEIHLEILSRALAVGYKVKEVPVVLKGREKGRSKFKFRGTVISHLLFSFYERPMIVFGVIGLALLGLGFLGGGYITILRFQKTLNPERPLMTLVVILLLAGMQILSFGFISIQLGFLRKEVYKIQKENRLLSRRLADIDQERT
jgi:dolichol-phosphate mannosyltransferase